MFNHISFIDEMNQMIQDFSNCQRQKRFLYQIAGIKSNFQSLEAVFGKFSLSKKDIRHYFPFCAVLCLVTQSCLTLCNPVDLPGTSVHGASPVKYTGVGCHGLPHGIPPGDLPNPGIEPRSLTMWEDFLPSEPPRKYKFSILIWYQR